MLSPHYLLRANNNISPLLELIRWSCRRELQTFIPLDNSLRANADIDIFSDCGFDTSEVKFMLGSAPDDSADDDLFFDAVSCEYPSKAWLDQDGYHADLAAAHSTCNVMQPELRSVLSK